VALRKIRRDDGLRLAIRKGTAAFKPGAELSGACRAASDARGFPPPWSIEEQIHPGCALGDRPFLAPGYSVTARF
jgi:hypothetical protein